MTPGAPEILHRLDAWAAAGWLRRLDSSLATFVSRLDPNASPALLAAVAVLACMEGRGHTCLPLTELAKPPADMLGWPQEQRDELEDLWRTLPGDAEDWVAALCASPVVESQGGSSTDTRVRCDGTAPLVLDVGGGQPRLYLRRYWNHERSIATTVLLRTEHPVAVDVPRAREWLDRLFEPASQQAPPEPIDWQKCACALALRGRFTIIPGGPGTGKTYTAARLLALLVVADGALTIDAALDDLWPDADPAAARNRFHQVLHRLRRSLGIDAGELLTVVDGVIRLDRARVDADR
ncbi:MAG: hypothetical protein WCP99_18160 [Burkholderiales bacterium]